MTQVEKILDKVHMIATEEGILHSEVESEVMIIKKCHTEDKMAIEIEVTIDSTGLEVNPDGKQGEPRVASRSPSRDKDKCFSSIWFGHFAKECPEKDTSSSKGQYREE